MKPKVVIIGHGYTSKLGMIRPIASIGAEISVISLENERRKPLDYYSKYISHYYFCRGYSAERLMEILTNDCIDYLKKVILIPTDDYTASFIDSKVNLLKDHFIFPHIHHEQGAIIEWMNKDKQKNLAKLCGIKIANATTFEIKNSSYHLLINA